jgi:hypothetical protein
VIVGQANWKLTNVLSAPEEVHKHHTKPRKKMSDNLLPKFQNFKKKALDHFLVPAPYLPHFLVCFECFKT